MVTLRLPPKMERKLVRAALVERLEDEEDLADAVRVMRRIECGEEKTVPLEEVARRLHVTLEN